MIKSYLIEKLKRYSPIILFKFYLSLTTIYVQKAKTKTKSLYKCIVKDIFNPTKQRVFLLLF